MKKVFILSSLLLISFSTLAKPSADWLKIIGDPNASTYIEQNSVRQLPGQPHVIKFKAKEVFEKEFIISKNQRVNPNAYVLSMVHINCHNKTAFVDGGSRLYSEKNKLLKRINASSSRLFVPIPANSFTMYQYLYVCKKTGQV